MWEPIAARKLRSVSMNVSKWNQIAVKAAVDGYLNQAIRDIDAALVWMCGEHVGPELKAQAAELRAIKDQLLSIMAKPAHAPGDT